MTTRTITITGPGRARNVDRGSRRRPARGWPRPHGARQRRPPFHGRPARRPGSPGRRPPRRDQPDAPAQRQPTRRRRGSRGGRRHVVASRRRGPPGEALRRPAWALLPGRVTPPSPAPSTPVCSSPVSTASTSSSPRAPSSAPRRPTSPRPPRHNPGAALPSPPVKARHPPQRGTQTCRFRQAETAGCLARLSKSRSGVVGFRLRDAHRAPWRRRASPQEDRSGAQYRPAQRRCRRLLPR
jgi:hypothetical protein